MRFSGYRHKYPVLRLVIPLIAGVLLCDSFLYPRGLIEESVWGCLSLGILFLSLGYFTNGYSFRWLNGMGIFIFILATGIGVTALRTEQSIWKEKSDEAVFVATVSAPLQEKNRTYLCPVEIIRRQNPVVSGEISKQVLLYLPKDTVCPALCIGDELLFYGSVSPPRNNGNPYEFDYARYLFHKGVSGIAYLSTGSWKKREVPNRGGLQKIAWECKEKILGLYRELGFKKDQFAVLSALTVGYKEELSDELKQYFSVSGISHLLALSGLHIGILYWLLAFLPTFLGRNQVARVLGKFFVILCLWAFAFMVGLPPSVVRAVVMCSLLVLSSFFTSRPATLNTLSVAAFLMLLYDPFYLFDVGFQLSFLSVAGILLIYPRLSAKLMFRSRLLRYLWQMTSVSVSAQIATGPLIAYYFSSLPVYFLLANLFAIPLVTLILYGAIAMLGLGFWPFLQTVVAGCLNWLLGVLNQFSAFVEQLPVSSVNQIHPTWVEISLFYLSISLLLAYFLSREKKVLFISLSCFVIWGGILFTSRISVDTVTSILFYNNRACPAVHFISSGERSYLLSARQDSVFERLNYATERFWNKKRITEPLLLTENYENQEVYCRDKMVCFGGKNICLVNDNRWSEWEATVPLSIDYLFICSGYKGTMREFIALFNVRKVVLDSSLSQRRLAFLKKECLELGLDFISLSEEGSYHIKL